MKNRNFYADSKGRMDPFVDTDGYTDAPPGEGLSDEFRIIEDFLPSPEEFRRNRSFVIVSDEQAAREDAERAARKAARELLAMPPLDRPYPKPQYAHLQGRKKAI